MPDPGAPKLVVQHQQLHEETFQDLMREWLKSAPWFMVSLVIHVIAGLIIANIDWQTLRADQVRVIQAQYQNDEIEPLPEEEEPPEEKEVEEVEEVQEDPTVTDEEIYEEVTEDDQNPIDSPFDGKNINDVIGVGGGAGGRFGGKYRRRRAGKRGGQATQKAVEWGLDWLKRHQDPEGFWDCDGFDAQCAAGDHCDGKGMALNDVGVTGLALLAFLGSGNTPTDGPYREVVRKGVRYLCQMQYPEDGCLTAKEDEHYMYNHAIGTLALTEAYGLSGMPVLKKHAKKAIEYIHKTKNPGKAWRYNDGAIDPIEQNDISVTGWMIMCLASAKDFGLPFDKHDIEDALAYIDEMTDTATGRTGYKERGSYSSREPGDELIWPFDKVEAMTGVGMFCRFLCGYILGNADDQMPMIDKGAKLLLAKPPTWDEGAGTIDYYYWYYGSYALFQKGGQDWKAWKDHMIKAVVEHQRTEGCAKGSWDPRCDPWGDNGGRVYSTALCTLCLEVFYRYDKILGQR